MSPGKMWGCSSAGRAPALQAGGHRFDPDYLHHGIEGLERELTNKTLAIKPSGRHTGL